LVRIGWAVYLQALVGIARVRLSSLVSILVQATVLDEGINLLI